MSSKRPILVTGSSRSGSTWVGRMLSVPSGIGYIHEPFNVDHRPGICSAKFDYPRTYVSNENEHLYYDHLKDTLDYEFKLLNGLKALRFPKDAVLLLKDYAVFSIYRRRKSRPLIKDPMASFSTEWLASRFDMEVLALIRHPAAYALSIKEMNWKPPFLSFLKQPLLMKDHLYPYEEEIRRLQDKGLKIIYNDELNNIKNARVLFRAHGEPPKSYKLAEKNNNEIIDASCPTILKIQKLIKEAYQNKENIYIYGKHNHPEIIGLTGQVNNKAVVFEDINELKTSKLPERLTLFSQTTKDINSFLEIVDFLNKNQENQ